MGFELIAILCVCYLFCLGVSLRTISNQNVLNNLEMKMVQPIDDLTDYDCVDIYKQPAFNHPLLKNHKIQMEPSFQVVKSKKSSKKSSSKGGGCPKGKVPIKKMNNSSLLLHSNISDQFHQFNRERPGEHFATLDTHTMMRYRGAEAFISIYNPPTKMNQVSMAQIWVQSGPSIELNSVQAGWAVHPRIYGDTRTYMTVFWTADNHKKTGCYNLLCPGFVQVDTHVYPGQPISSSVAGGQQNILHLKIVEDKTTGNWWLYSQSTLIGYWPTEIFSYMQSGSLAVRYGGRTTTGPDGTSPPMGSGHFASIITNQNCFFSKMKVISWDYEEYGVSSEDMEVNVDSLNCYTLDYLGYQGQSLGQVLTIGGPGGNCGV